MIKFEQAYDIIINSARPMDVEHVDLADALGRILAQDVFSDLDMPPFDKSAMDGYACRRDELGEPLAVLETIKAGVPPTKAIGPKQCAKIMTGAMVPEGADCVFMVEFSEEVGEGNVRFAGEETRTNICYRGEDIRTGDIVLYKGAMIAPEHMAVLATVGCVKPRVACRPRVGVIATGDELVEPHQKPARSQIRTSNSVQLIAQTKSAGAIPTYYGIAKDTKEDLGAIVEKALGENDVLLLSGGVSMGDYDFVPAIFKAKGLDILFDAIAMKPGKPTNFAVSDGKWCFGLPGNPVSTFVQFEIFVRPFLHKLMGREGGVADLYLPLEEDMKRKKTERLAWVPVQITEAGGVTPCEYHGSAHVNGLCKADGLMAFPLGEKLLKKGTPVRVRQF